MDLELQMALFREVLIDLQENPDMTNQVLEVNLSDTGDQIELVHYEMPTA